jgi:hypothetical protein
MPNENTRRNLGDSPHEQIGKVFAVRRGGLLECLVCGEMFSRENAREHAEVDCYPAVEFCLLEPVGHKK